MAITWDILLTTTFLNYRKKFVDNVSKHHAFKAALKAHGGVERRVGGTEWEGTGQIAIPLMTELFDNDFKYLANKLDTFSANYHDEAKVAGYNWGTCVLPIKVPYLDVIDNAGAAKLIDMMKTKMTQAELTMANQVNKTLCGTSSDPNAPDGIKDIVFPYKSGDPTYGTWNTIGGINSATETFWRNQYVDASSLTARNAMIKGWNAVYKEIGQGVTIFLADQNAWETIEANVYDKTAYNVTGSVKNVKSVDIGHPTLTFNGSTIVWDAEISNPFDADKGILYGINTTYTKETINSKLDNKFFKFVRPKGDSSDLVMRALIVHRHCLTCSNRRANVVIYNIS